jgi:hypothetical protein
VTYCTRCGEPEPHGAIKCALTLAALSRNECPECGGLGVVPTGYESSEMSDGAMEACRHRWHEMPDNAGVSSNGRDA